MTKQEAITAIRGFVAASSVEVSKAIRRPQFGHIHHAQSKAMIDEAEKLAEEFNLGNPFTV